MVHHVKRFYTLVKQVVKSARTDELRCNNLVSSPAGGCTGDREQKLLQQYQRCFGNPVRILSYSYVTVLTSLDHYE